MKRREFIGLLGGAAAAWPVAARAQQPALPVIGFLNSESQDAFVDRLRAFDRGLAETGYVAGQNVVMEYRWAEGRYDRVPGLVADLVGRKVAVIVANYPPVTAARAATSTIPIVFTSAPNPAKLGLVASFNRPGGNVTGVHLIGALESKRLELLHQLVPAAATIGVLLNPKNPEAKSQLRDLQEASSLIKRPIYVARASTASEIDTGLAAISQQGIGALLIASDPFFSGRREQLVALVAHNKLPTMYIQREFAQIGGLISYGT